MTEARIISYDDHAWNKMINERAEKMKTEERRGKSRRGGSWKVLMICRAVSDLQSGPGVTETIWPCPSATATV